MICEKCNANMKWLKKDSVQGWICSKCGWNFITTNIDDIYEDTKEYSIYIKNNCEVDIKKIKLISKLAGVNYIKAKKLLVEEKVCIFKSRAIDVKNVLKMLDELNIKYEVVPKFKY